MRPPIHPVPRSGPPFRHSASSWSRARKGWTPSPWITWKKPRRRIKTRSQKSEDRSRNEARAGGDFSVEEKRGVYRAIYERRDVRGQFLRQPLPPPGLGRILDAAHHA